MLLFCNPTPSHDRLPLPLPSPFPPSLRAVLLPSTHYGVTMEDVVLLSLMVPQLERLQVANLIVVGNASLQHEVTAPSYFFPALNWLAVGAFERSSTHIHDPRAMALSLLLDTLAIGSGLPNLRRLDILTDIVIPDRFLDMHAALIHTLTIPSAQHEGIRAANIFPGSPPYAI
ncbi:hypothetical protein DFP72DRAFT_1075739 [Ephemerocybe angulata]|uniref:Uncharacterized protein n=1 Tax=Ephemerocybe angulata TaxID=980116 RepID=A0A8H6LX00_9AGAR|nr:hypothetical protein DFP72DRAFT_1075739 [Tulosesus angulatus]